MNLTEAKQKWNVMDQEEKLAMAKACPSVLMPWTSEPDGTLERRLRNLPILWTGIVSPSAENMKARWIVKLDNGDTLKGSEETTAEALAACDAELLRQGYVLDNVGDHT